MRKGSKNVLAILFTLCMLLVPMCAVHAKDEEATLKNGTYPVLESSFVKADGGTSKRTFTVGETLEVKEGVAYVTITVDSVSYTKAKVNEIEYAGTKNGGNTTFEIPTTLNENVAVSLYTTAMSDPHWIDFTMYVKAEVPVAGETESGTGWKDGTYVGTATVTNGEIASGGTTKYPSSPYEINVVVEIKNGKITSVRYKDALPMDGNMCYKNWAMDGCNLYDATTKTWSYLPGVGTQTVAGKSVDDADIVSGATRVSYGVKEAMNKALKKAEKGETDTVSPIPAEPETPDKVVKSGIYDVENIKCSLSTIVDAKLTSKSGKMTAVIRTRSTARDIIYFGTEEEAKAAGESAWSFGKEVYIEEIGKTGLQFEIPVKSIDKQLYFVMHAVSSNKWNVQTIQFNSEDLVKVADVQDTEIPDTNKPNTDKPNTDKPNTDGSNTGKPAQKPSEGSVQTGDTATMTSVWASIALLSFGCVAVLIDRKRNRT